MTGKHTGHAHIRGNARLDLRPEDVTVAELLKGAGYRTGLFGKWGLGTAGGSGIPTRKGFDEFFGFLDQGHAHTYYPTQLWNGEREYFLRGNFGDRRTDYAPDLFTKRAAEFIEQNKANPFFLYFATTLPHANNEMFRQTGNGNQVPEDAPYSSRDWPQPDKNFAAMVSRLDGDTGRVLDALKSAGVDGNTLVIFSSDNGPHREGGNRPEFFRSNGGLRGIKRDLYEGGIRVPAIARWPGRIKPGSTSDQPWAFWDFLPTAAEASGAGAPQGIDGKSILPALAGKALPERTFYWEFHERGFKQAVRMGNWKAVRKGTKNPVELYDLTADPSETRDVAASKPDIAKRATELFRDSRTESTRFPVADR